MSRRSKTPASRMCVLCGERWAQSKLGLCRKCERATGADLRSTFERERDQVRAIEAATPKPKPAPVAMGPMREVTIDGRTYVVLWDGARPHDAIDPRDWPNSNGGGWTWL